MREQTSSTTASRSFRTTPKADAHVMPAHVAIIMDGNGRWASGRGLSRSEGHGAGVENVRRVLRRFTHHGVKFVTVFAFSTENWDRPNQEVGALIELLGQALRDETEALHEQGVRIRHIGRLDHLPAPLQKAIRESMEMTRDNDVMTLSVAYDYGARAEIIDAVRAIAAAGIAPEDITEEVFQRHLYTSGLPDPDLVIRTGGEMRLSNFLLWQASYSEFYSTPVLWPDFDESQVDNALDAYALRQRRYGKLAPAESP